MLGIFTRQIVVSVISSCLSLYTYTFCLRTMCHDDQSVSRSIIFTVAVQLYTVTHIEADVGLHVNNG